MRLRFDRPHRVLFLAVSVLAPFACVNSSDTPPPPPTFDAGPGYDAQGVDTSVPDVAIPDGGVPDSPAEAEAGPTTASVTVLSSVGGAPKAGVTAVFSDANGNLVDTKTTGADGKATATAAAGGMITVAVGGPGQRELFTFVGVKPGDDLVAFDVAVAPPTPPELSVDLPANPPPTAVRYDVYAGVCSGQGTVSPVLDQLFDACYRGGKAPVVAIATDANFARVGFAYKKGNAIDVDGGLAQVTGLGPWSLTLGTYNVAVTNAPAAIQSAQFASVEVADSVSLPQYQGNPLEAGGGSATFPTLPGYADWFQPQVMVNTPANGGALQAYVFSARRVPPAASGATETFDLSQLLPAISTLDFDTTTTAGRPTATWTSAAPLTGTDGGLLRINWVAQLDGGAFDTIGWSFLVPPTATSVQAPILPAALAAWTPPAQVSLGPPVLAFIESDLVSGYDQLRAQYAIFALANYEMGQGQFEPPPLPAPGNLRGTFVYNPG